jgi:MFS transporter, SHS family, sialic acid transporter
MNQSPGQRPSTVQWVVLTAALLGWMFDGLEMGLFPIAARPALLDLMHPGGNLSAPVTSAMEADVAQWISYLVALFLLGAACGGLLFGWLGDRIGRVRTMALTIFVFSFFTGCCYFASAPWHLGVFRFLAALGMGGEWSLGVALVVECWPDRLRPILAGTIGAAGNVGYLLIAALAMTFRVTPESWRWTMLAGTAPVLLAVLVIALVPESQRWQKSVQAARAKPIREVFSTPLVWKMLLAITFASVALVGTWGAVTGFLPAWADQLAGPANPHAKGTVQFVTSIGAILGCFFAPLIGGRIGRRPAYFGLCLLSLLVCQFLFRLLHSYDLLFLATAMLAGCATASFYGWLPLYLPELFPTRVRATGQGLSYNFGRIFAAAGALGTGQLMQFFHGSYTRACGAISLVYVLGLILIWLAPETRGKPLPE